MNARIKASRKASEAAILGGVADAVGDMLGDIAKKHKAALDGLRAEAAVLKSEVSELRAEAKMCGALKPWKPSLPNWKHRHVSRPLAE